MPNPPHTFNPLDWRETVEHYDAQRRPEIPDKLSKDEIRWGDSALFSVPVPGAFAGDTSSEFRTLVQIEHPARAWKIAIGLQFLNPATGLAGDTMNGDAILEYGSGSAKIATLRTVPITQAAAAAGFTIADITFDLPFRSLTGVVRLRYTSIAGAARVMQGRVILLCAPIVRDI